MSCRAKLFANSGKEWKERGQGTFKLNVSEDLQEDFETSAKSARLLMRADGSHRVVLNTPIFKSMKIGDRGGKVPSGGSVLFTGIEDGKPVPLLLKVSMPLFTNHARYQDGCLQVCMVEDTQYCSRIYNDSEADNFWEQQLTKSCATDLYDHVIKLQTHM